LAAPVAIAHTHVHSMRLASGKEALVARVLAADGTAGYGFTLNEDASVARDMAAWDALCRSRKVALGLLLGGSYRKSVPLVKDDLPALAPDWANFRKGVLDNRWKLLRIDPFAWGSVEMMQTLSASATAFDLGVALLAPNEHPWELQYCAALAATIKGDDSKVIVRKSPERNEIPVKDAPGVGVDWDSEPGFAQIRWQNPQK
jgi:L-alanine-DL-glutamate epimerase-like enolase superfamily enzyme